jgi:hypothetical protein
MLIAIESEITKIGNLAFSLNQVELFSVFINMNNSRWPEAFLLVSLSLYLF